ncbi:hypothetical protein IJD34_08330 [bacterium]|nr:hypothetical protein [bacterium]
MGMDGLSMANTGAIKESTSADYTSRTEQVMQADKTNDPKQVQNLSTNRHVKEKEDEEESKKQNGQEGSGDEEELFEDGLITEEPKEEFDIQELDNPNKDFYVKLNAKDDIIELYDSSSDRLIETISGNELTELVRKLNMASGIFVNKKV